MNKLKAKKNTKNAIKYSTNSDKVEFSESWKVSKTDAGEVRIVKFNQFVTR